MLFHFLLLLFHQSVVDVRTCIVTSPTNCWASARTPGTAAALGAAEKARAWLPVAQGFSVYAFCVEEGGRFGEACERFLRHLSLPLTSTNSDRAAFMTYALQHLHITNQRGIARVINALKPIPAGPHVCSHPTFYELAVPPARPQVQVRTSAPISFHPPWAAAPNAESPSVSASEALTNPPHSDR